MFYRRIAFGLGSNIGNREMMIAHAIEALCALEGMDSSSLQCSDVQETPALLDKSAPVDWDLAYLNQVIIIAGSELLWNNPAALLVSTQQIEKTLGKQKRGHWAPREIDIDIVAIDGVSYHSANLTIPHAQAHLRDFVVKPLAMLWPDCALWDGRTAQQVAKAL